MPLTGVFNDTQYRADKVNNNVLEVYGGNSIYYSYDFAARLVVTRYSSTGVSVTPFSQMDPETLETMHKKLTELGGRPPPLPGNDIPATVKPAPQRRLNA